jgi:16S rRNA (adenine1518-N6/adenine1519-N6)-dimethyltransferase
VPKTAEHLRRHSKPKLGQHFLTDQGAALRIVEALGEVSQRTVLEVGPGRGVLTTLLARRARRLIAVELDRVLAAQLRMKYALTPNVEIIEADVLAVDIDSLFAPKPGSTRPGLELTLEPVRVVGNIPYYITSDLLLRLFEHRRHFETMVLMVQSEVADRLIAKPGGSEYGLLSATAQLYSRVEKVFSLPASAFSPPPKVSSAVVRLSLDSKLDALGVPERPFLDFLKMSFAQKRKTLWNNLKETYPAPALKAAMEKLNIKSTSRAETLSLEKNAALFRELAMPNDQ